MHAALGGSAAGWSGSHTSSQSVCLTLLIAGSTALTRPHTATDNYLFFESAAAVPRMHLDTVNRTYASRVANGVVQWEEAYEGRECDVYRALMLPALGAVLVATILKGTVSSVDGSPRASASM